MVEPSDRVLANIGKDLPPLPVSVVAALVKIQGLEGIYLVKDKMHRRKRNQIDIYMGRDVKKAKIWGVQRLKIKYGVFKSEQKGSI